MRLITAEAFVAAVPGVSDGKVIATEHICVVRHSLYQAGASDGKVIATEHVCVVLHSLYQAGVAGHLVVIHPVLTACVRRLRRAAQGGRVREALLANRLHTHRRPQIEL